VPKRLRAPSCDYPAEDLWGSEIGIGIEVVVSLQVTAGGLESGDWLLTWVAVVKEVDNAVPRGRTG
jgi:hypothetical protein